jgi:hypothetical protein
MNAFAQFKCKVKSSTLNVDQFAVISAISCDIDSIIAPVFRIKRIKRD